MRVVVLLAHPPRHARRALTIEVRAFSFFVFCFFRFLFSG